MKYLFSILILLTSYASYTQPYFRHYGAEHGLPNNAVWCSTQDEEGFMWFGTQNGLSRFDGIHFKNFKIPTKKNNSSSRDDIASLCKDNNGTLWVAAGKGLFTYDKLEEKLVPFIDTLTNICLKNIPIFFWAVWPYETMMVSKRQVQYITQLSKEEKTSFAIILKKLTTKYDNLFQVSFLYHPACTVPVNNGSSAE